MADFNVRSDSVNVEQIMEQIRARIREKRGIDYTEQQVRELANGKIEKFLDSRTGQSDLLEEFRRMQATRAIQTPPSYSFGEETLIETHRAPLRFLRRLLQPVLKLFINPNPLIKALHDQAEVNSYYARQEEARRRRDRVQIEILHNVLLETTRMSLEIKSLRMRMESLTSRLEFSERRARSLESVLAYRPPQEDRDSSSAVAVSSGSAERGGPGREPTAGVPHGLPTEGAQRSRRRRRRRGRRGGGPASEGASAPGPGAAEASSRSGQETSGGSGQEHAGDSDLPAAVESIHEALAVETHRNEPVEPPPLPSAAPASPVDAGEAGSPSPAGSRRSDEQ